MTPIWIAENNCDEEEKSEKKKTGIP